MAMGWHHRYGCITTITWLKIFLIQEYRIFQGIKNCQFQQAGTMTYMVTISISVLIFFSTSGRFLYPSLLIHQT
jgi:hypothetical protein